MNKTPKFALLALGTSLAACNSDSLHLGTSYAACVTDDDCDSHMPTCRTVQLHGRTGSWCTRACEISDGCARIPANAFSDMVPVCIGIDSTGAVADANDPGTDRICAVSCNPSEPQCLHDGESCVPAHDPATSFFAVCAE